MKSILRLISIYLIVLFSGLILYTVSFSIPIGIDIIFYRGILLALLVFVIIIIFLAVIGRNGKIDSATIVGASAVSLSLNICFLVLFVVTIDRSISVFLLSRIADHPLTTSDLQREFEREYLGSMEQIRRRVFEQGVSGNIVVDVDGRIFLTERGRHFVSLVRSGSAWFNTDRRFVYSEPTRSNARVATRDH